MIISAFYILDIHQTRQMSVLALPETQGPFFLFFILEEQFYTEFQPQIWKPLT